MSDGVAVEQPDDPVSSAFLRCVGREGHERCGVALASVWLDIHEALDPVLGRRGVEALYRRSVHLAQVEYPWLAGTHDRVPLEDRLETLARVVEAQDPAEAARAGASLLRAFCRLLASLVGPALTERLLRPVLSNLSSVAGARDEAP